MSRILTAIGLGIVGFLAPRALVGAGIPLDQWAKDLGIWLGLSLPWLESHGLTTLAFCLATVLIVAELWWQPVGRTLHRIKNSFFKDAEVIDLNEAAIRAYEETRHTGAGQIAERLNEDNVLGYYRHALMGMDGVRLLGCRPPSRKLEEIPREEFGRISFSADGNSCSYHGEDRVAYNNLQIRTDDLDKYIKTALNLG